MTLCLIFAHRHRRQNKEKYLVEKRLENYTLGDKLTTTKKNERMVRDDEERNISLGFFVTQFICTLVSNITLHVLYTFFLFLKR